MNDVINYIILHDRFTNLPDYATKLLFIYNNKNEKKLKWLNIMLSPLSCDIQKKIIYVYSSRSCFDFRMYELMLCDSIDIVIKTHKDLYDKTFIKFLYDLNYLNNALLTIFNAETKFYQINPGIVLNCNNYYKLHQYEINKINETKKDNIYFYLKISENLDKKITKKLGYFIRELVMIQNQWWLVTTGYNDKIEEDKDAEKIIQWIFAEVI